MSTDVNRIGKMLDHGCIAAELLPTVFQKEAEAGKAQHEQPVACADRCGIGGEKRFGSHANLRRCERGPLNPYQRSCAR